MPQARKVKGKVKKTDHKAKNAAKASIALRTSAQGQENRVLRGVGNWLADKQLEKAMKRNKATRERRKVKGKVKK